MHRELKMKMLPFGVLIVAAASLSANVWQDQKIKALELRPASYRMDQPFVQKAAAYWLEKSTSNGGLSDMYNRYAKVIYFGERVCVSLDLISGVGGTPVYCFNKKSGALVERYDDVE